MFEVMVETSVRGTVLLDFTFFVNKSQLPSPETVFSDSEFYTIMLITLNITSAMNNPLIITIGIWCMHIIAHVKELYAL